MDKADKTGPRCRKETMEQARAGTGKQSIAINIVILTTPFFGSGFNTLLPQQLFHPRFQHLVGAEQADVCFKLGVQLRRRFPVHLRHDGGVRLRVHFPVPLSAIDREQPVGERADNGVSEGAIVLKEKLPVQQLVHRQIVPGLEIIARPVEIFDAPPFAVKIHGKALRHSGTDRAVPNKADEVRVLVETDTLDALVIYGIDAVRQVGKAVAGEVVAIDMPDLLRGIAEEVFDLKVRRQAEHGADMGEAALLQRGDLFNVALGCGVRAVVEDVVFGLKRLHGSPPKRI